MNTSLPNKLLIRAEDSDHPKLDRLRRAVAVEVGAVGDVSSPWVAWGSGLSRAWLVTMLDSGAQVLIMPPWHGNSIAGLPPVREVDTPGAELQLQKQVFAVSASSAIEPSQAWQEHGTFANAKLAWLVSHELFAGSGRVWLSTAEVLVTSPSTRPSEAKRVLAAIVSYVATFCPKRLYGQEKSGNADIETEGHGEFTKEDVPYLLAAAALPAISTTQVAAEFVLKRLGVKPELGHLERILRHPVVQSEMSKSVGSRLTIGKIVDSLGFRSFRLEIEETCHE